ncbi:hypothetical protein [Micromonospora sp. SH-82]|uniref:hypothetical protein n=1 Tax=Micromonospora sp. SH-82 TaxID=3132938 RepID=UPI003EC0C998
MPQEAIRPDQVAHHQKVLDETRVALHRVLFGERLSALVVEHIRDAGDFTAGLNDYRFMADAWSRTSKKRFEPDEPDSIRFEQAKRCYGQIFDTLRGSVDTSLNGVSGDDRLLLAEAGRLLRSVGDQEDALRRARTAVGEGIAAWTRKSVNLTNQADHFIETQGKCWRAIKVHSDLKVRGRVPDMDTFYGQSAFLALRTREAKCQDVMALAFTRADALLYDRERKIGDLLTNKRLEVRDESLPKAYRNHALLFLGDPDRPESVAVDAWTRLPTVTGAFNYSWEQVHAAVSIHQANALGRDLLAEGEKRIDKEWLRTRKSAEDLRVLGATMQDVAQHPAVSYCYAIDHARYDWRDKPHLGTVLNKAALCTPLDRDPRFSATAVGSTTAAGTSRRPSPTPPASSAQVAQVAQVAGLASPRQPSVDPTAPAVALGVPRHRSPSPQAAGLRR